jgi:hypothetical protein
VESLSYGAKLGGRPSDTGHGSIMVGDSLATQKMRNCPLIEVVTIAI